MLNVGKTAKSAYERKLEEEEKAGSGMSFPSEGKNVVAKNNAPTEEEGVEVPDISSAIAGVEKAISSRNWKLLKAYWEDLKSMLPQPENEAQEA